MTEATKTRICNLYREWIGYDPREDDPAGFDAAETVETLRGYREECLAHGVKLSA